ncbi:ASCH domain-containing protein [Infirmifilum lucidum]|uniref:ASCH domain-containing protein n=1 Tax=Infirmifilum lucidum TaxID=2776706 RepID=A0A7L9FHA3_9CREN|nr:ASCH domain-containing protein [Infirmifilum lucidum]QOJ78306.1 ASCH domain-containing protein [Infirmifilum lucidum]
MIKRLMFSKKYIPLILSGRKTATIRATSPGVKPGDVILIHAGGKIIGKAVIKEVRRLRLGEITDEIARLDGFNSAEELTKALREHYQYLGEKSYVYLVTFELTEKFESFVDEHLEAWPYAETPREVAKIALQHLELDGDERNILILVAREGSIRRAAYKLGDIKLRPVVRGVLREVARRLEERGLVKRRA